MLWIVQELSSRKFLLKVIPAFLKKVDENDDDEMLLKKWHQLLIPKNLQWLSHGLLLMWAFWIFWLVKYKEGDFPLILFIITTFAAVISLIDKWYFYPKRERLLVEGERNNICAKDGQDYRLTILAGMPAAETAKSFFPILLLVFVLRSFVIEPFKIPSSSMVPTLLINDFILVNKFTYGIRLPVLRTKILDINEPQRGDVMVFFPPNDKRYFIKRVMGVPGDHIRYVNHALYINGERMEQVLLEELPPENPQNFVMRESLPDGSSHLMRKRLIPSILSRHVDITVPEGHYFMMGDNRDNSSDSRRWGFVPEENLVGEAFAVWMHWGGLTKLPSFSRNGRIE